MIGILGGLGTVVGREMAEEALGRIIAGRTTEDLFAQRGNSQKDRKGKF